MENKAGMNIEWVILLGSFGMITLALSIIVFAALYQRKYAQKKAQLHEKDLQHQKLLVNAVIETKEQEQKRIAMELHDDVGSALTAIKFMVSGIEIDAETKDVLQESISSAISNVRRISNDLLPSILDEMGLKTAMLAFVKTLPETVHFTSSGQEWTNLPKSVSLALYRITQELINNILKYAEADVAGCVLEDIRDDLHGRRRRINVCVPHHELFQDVILNGSGKLFLFYALLFGCYDVEGENRDNGSVHGHGNRHFVQRDLVKQDFHVQHGINGYSGFSYVANHAFVIRIVAAMRGKVECNGQSFLAGCEVPAVKCVRFFGCGKPGVLANGPRANGIHGAIRPAKERSFSADKSEVFGRFHRFRIVIAVECDLFGGYKYRFVGLCMPVACSGCNVFE